MAKGLYLGDAKKQNPVSHQGGMNQGQQDYDAVATQLKDILLGPS